MKSIFTQSAWLFLAQAGSRLISFFYILYLAKVLGANNFGVYSVALSFFAIFSALGEFGFNRLLIRETAIDHNKSSNLVSNIGFIRLIWALVLVAFLSGLLFFLDPSTQRVKVIILAILTIIPLSLAQTLDSVLIATKRAHLSAISALILNLATVGFGLWLLKESFGLNGVALALVLGQCMHLITLLLILKGKIKYKLNINFSSLKELLKEAFPYGVLAILGLLYFKIDTVILSYLRGNLETGLYNGAYRFLDGIIFIPAALETAIFPVMSRLQKKDNKDSYLTYVYFSKIMILSAIPFVLIFLVLIPFVFNNFLTEYKESLNALKVLALSIPFIFLLAPQGGILLSSKRFLKPLILISVFSVIFNISGNLILIQMFGFMGAAWMTVASAVISCLMYFSLIEYFFKGRKKGMRGAQG